MFKNKAAFVSALLAFVTQLLIVQHYAAHSWFWTDEIFSSLSVLRISTWEYLKGNASEGNCAPLFYLILKALLYLQKPLAAWIPDPIPFLRFFTAVLPTAVFVAAATKRAFEIPAKNYHKWLAALGTFLALNGTHGLFAYSWQARPYALWACFTWVFLEAVVMEIRNRGHERRLSLSAFLLGITTPLAFLQIALGWAALLLFLEGHLKARFRTALVMLPGLLAGAYYAAKVPGHYAYVWPGLYGALLLVTAHAKYWMVLPTLLFLAPVVRNRRGQALLFLLAGVAAIAAATTLNLYLRRSAGPAFTISNRYYFFLLPSLSVLFLEALAEAAATKVRWLQPLAITVFVLIGALGAQRFLHERPTFAGPPIAELMKAQLQGVSVATGQTKCFCMENQAGMADIDFWGGYLLWFRSLDNGCSEYFGLTAKYEAGYRSALLNPTGRKRSPQHLDTTYGCGG
ncbi:MAG TPA: hypothetical protein VIH99_10005 [Bdellovibrionota bacterium]